MVIGKSATWPASGGTPGPAKTPHSPTADAVACAATNARMKLQRLVLPRCFAATSPAGAASTCAASQAASAHGNIPHAAQGATRGVKLNAVNTAAAAKHAAEQGPHDGAASTRAPSVLIGGDAAHVAETLL